MSPFGLGDSAKLSNHLRFKDSLGVPAPNDDVLEPRFGRP